MDGKVSGEMGGVGESEGILCMEGDDEEELVDIAAVVSDLLSGSSPKAGTGGGYFEMCLIDPHRLSLIEGVLI